MLQHLNYDPTTHLILYFNASQNDVGAVLQQRVNDTITPSLNDYHQPRSFIAHLDAIY